MNTQSAAANQQQGRSETILVVTPDNGKYRVYDARNPNVTFDVAGTREAPWCSCPEYQANRNAPGFRCGHIDVVFPRSGNGQPAQGQASGGAHQPADIPPVQMTLKRSVSPDGRIDSLSVEFTGDVCDAPDEEIIAQALRTTNLQTAIVNGFLVQRRGTQANAPQPQSTSDNGNGQAAPATLTSISGMQTKVGWRYFVNVQTGGKEYKLFGTRDQLADHLRAAGHGHAAGNIAKGVTLNLPCMAVTRPSDDGKYVNVERILPADNGGNGDGVPF